MFENVYNVSPSVTKLDVSMAYWCQKSPTSLSGKSLLWRHNGHDSISNHQPHDCLLNRLFRRRSKKTSKLCVTGLFVGNSPGTGEFPTQMTSNAENASIWWRHHVHRWAKIMMIPYWVTHMLNRSHHPRLQGSRCNYYKILHIRKLLSESL